MRNITKSVTMFIDDVRYHTGRVYMHLPAMPGTKLVSGTQENPTMNLPQMRIWYGTDEYMTYSCARPHPTMKSRNQKQTRCTPFVGNTRRYRMRKEIFVRI
jgi:hypothetical protein